MSSPTVDRSARDKLTGEVRRFLAGEVSAFAFDEAIFEIRGATVDETVRTAVDSLWLFYDDCDDHFVAMSKPEWDFVQRLLLVLESDRHMVQTSSRRWAWTQLVALAALLAFAACVWWFGIGEHLLVLAIPFGIVSLAISWWRQRFEPNRDSRVEAILPFSSFAELRAVYLAVGRFRKARYRNELANSRIRSSLAEFGMRLPTTAAWLLCSPLPLCFQVLPMRRVRVRVV